MTLKQQRAKEYYEKNKERLLEKQRAWYAENKSRSMEYMKQYREKNRDKLLESKKAHYQANKPIWRKRQLRTNYGSAVDQATPVPEVCDICKRKPRGKRKELHFDHCHTTGKFRGWLCHGCNTSLGHASDDPNILRAMAEYLEKSNGVE